MEKTELDTDAVSSKGQKKGPEAGETPGKERSSCQKETGKDDAEVGTFKLGFRRLNRSSPLLAIEKPLV